MEAVQVSVIGTGYVGLVTGACLAERGARVMCMDVDQSKVNRLKRGQPPIYEPGLDRVVHRAAKAGRLAFTTDLQQAADADIIFLALPTPPQDDGSADLQYVKQVAKQLGPLLSGYTVVVNKSTVPVGTAQTVRDLLREGVSKGASFDVASNPEFLREGHAVQDFMNPDRIVVGTRSDRAYALMRRLYEPFTDAGARLIQMDEASAEMTKYAANSFLALKVSFINEIANLCDALGANVDDVAAGIGSDPRISPQFLRPGIGFGGSCFPKDVLALRRTARQVMVPLKTLDAVVGINTRQKLLLVRKLLDHFEGSVRGKHFALWGLAFKPDTDDIRESPALEMVRVLGELGATVTAYDPAAMDNVRNLTTHDNLTLAQDKYEALDGSEALLVATEWKEFVEAELEIIAQGLSTPNVFDGRNIWLPADAKRAGLEYKSVGRPGL